VNQYGPFDIRKRIAKKGWTLVGNYKNAHQKCEFACPSGHLVLAQWCVLKLGFFCRSCADERIKEKLRGVLAGTTWSVFDVKAGLVTIQCDKGHFYCPCRISDIKSKIVKAPSCNICNQESHAANVAVLFSELGWTMLEPYKSTHEPIRCVCPAGHIQMKSPSGLLEGKGCQRCAGLVRKTQPEIEAEFVAVGWKVAGVYINSSLPMDCVCPAGHEVKKSLDGLRLRTGCYVCAGQTPVHPAEWRKRRNERLKNYREWQPLVLARDGFKCVICGSTDDLNAHHLNSYHRYVEDRYDLANGVTLCLPHHGSPFARIKGSFHMKYGFRNNTREQFEEYKSAFASILTRGEVKL
jgi:5-methylcytosine-specific restriction endonuclease McrA